VLRYLQGKKWLKELTPDSHPQMAENKGKHFYIFKPVQLKSGKIAFPIFLYTEGWNLRAKCTIPHLTRLPGQSRSSLQIPGGLTFDLDLLHVSERGTVSPDLLQD
jgi:hypothetical protein